jgi:3-methyl-2-oxobutanoate hydroxymethyltransferase
MSTQTGSRRARVTTKTVVDLKHGGQKIAMITAYDFTMARIFDAAGIDIILVGDSASNVMAGNETTLPITIEEMIYHTKCVVKGASHSLVVADLPFMSYQVTPEKALISAGRMMKEAGAHAVKLEGGATVEPAIRKIVDSGIPVMGHLGLTPQSIYQFGTYQVRAKSDDEAQRLKHDALLLEKAGCFAIVLEKIPADLATEVSASLSIPTIGIGAGAGCDGQVLVAHDLLGLNNDFHPRFVRRYASLEDIMTGAVQSYISDIRSGSFPSKDEQY